MSFSSHQWSIELLGRISSNYGNRRGVPHSSSLNEQLQLWMSCKGSTNMFFIIHIVFDWFCIYVGHMYSICPGYFLPEFVNLITLVTLACSTVLVVFSSSCECSLVLATLFFCISCHFSMNIYVLSRNFMNYLMMKYILLYNSFSLCLYSSRVILTVYVSMSCIASSEVCVSFDTL